MRIFNFIKSINNQTKISNENTSSFKEASQNLAASNSASSKGIFTSSSFELLNLSAQERVNLIKELLSLPNDLKGLNELLKTLAKNNNINLTQLKELISQNSKEGLNKLIALNTINAQNGAVQTKEIQDVMSLLAAISIPSKTTPEIFKEIINIYIPIANPKDFEVQIEEKSSEGLNNQNESFVSFLIESKELGLFFTEIFKEDNKIICMINTSSDNKGLIDNIKTKIEYKVQINFVESENDIKQDFQDKVVFFQNNIADLDILNFMLNFIKQIYLEASRFSENS